MLHPWRLSAIVSFMLLLAASPLAAMGVIGSSFITPSEMEQEFLDAMESEAGAESANFQFNFDYGINMYQMSGGITYQGDLGAVQIDATPLDAEQDLGLDQESGSRIGFQMILGLLRFGASYTPEFKLEGTENRPYDITFGQFTFIANREIDSLADGSYATAEIGLIVLPLADSLGFELGVGIAAHAFLDMTLAIEGIITEPTTMLEVTRTETATFPVMPIPAIAIFAGIYPGYGIGIEPALHILKTPDLSSYSEDVNKLEGTLIELSLTAKYMLFDHVGIGARVAMMTTKINADVDDGDNQLKTNDLKISTFEISFVISLAFG